MKGEHDRLRRDVRRLKGYALRSTLALAVLATTPCDSAGPEREGVSLFLGEGEARGVSVHGGGRSLFLGAEPGGSGRAGFLGWRIAGEDSVLRAETVDGGAPAPESARP